MPQRTVAISLSRSRLVLVVQAFLIFFDPSFTFARTKTENYNGKEQTSRSRKDDPQSGVRTSAASSPSSSKINSAPCEGSRRELLSQQRLRLHPTRLHRPRRTNGPLRRQLLFARRRSARGRRRRTPHPRRRRSLPSRLVDHCTSRPRARTSSALAQHRERNAATLRHLHRVRPRHWYSSRSVCDALGVWTHLPNGCTHAEIAQALNMPSRGDVVEQSTERSTTDVIVFLPSGRSHVAESRAPGWLGDHSL